jgi:hypothetical protein
VALYIYESTRAKEGDKRVRGWWEKRRHLLYYAGDCYQLKMVQSLYKDYKGRLWSIATEKFCRFPN